jgi:hypothetical protein
MTAFTFARVVSLTRGLACRTSETVDFDTPAARAISTTVTRFLLTVILPASGFALAC